MKRLRWSTAALSVTAALLDAAPDLLLDPVVLGPLQRRENFGERLLLFFHQRRAAARERDHSVEQLADPRLVDVGGVHHRLAELAADLALFTIELDAARHEALVDLPDPGHLVIGGLQLLPNDLLDGLPGHH